MCSNVRYCARIMLFIGFLEKRSYLIMLVLCYLRRLMMKMRMTMRRGRGRERMMTRIFSLSHSGTDIPRLKVSVLL